MTVPSREAAAPLRSGSIRRTWVGAVLAGAGAVMSFLGWWGVSDKPSLAEQLPYLASGSIPGAALIVAGAVLLARDAGNVAAERTADLVAELRDLLVEVAAEVPPTGTIAPAVDAPAMGVAGSDLVVLPDGGHVHRADCLLARGKEVARVDDLGTAMARGLSACPVCLPELPVA